MVRTTHRLCLTMPHRAIDLEVPFNALLGKTQPRSLFMCNIKLSVYTVMIEGAWKKCLPLLEKGNRKGRLCEMNHAHEHPSLLLFLPLSPHVLLPHHILVHTRTQIHTSINTDVPTDRGDGGLEYLLMCVPCSSLAPPECQHLSEEEGRTGASLLHPPVQIPRS